MSSRLTSTGVGGSSTTTVAATAAGATAAGAAVTAAGRASAGATGIGAGLGGRVGPPGRAGDPVTRGGANGPAGWRQGRRPGAGRSMGRNGTIFGPGFVVPAASGVMVATGVITAGRSGGGGGAPT